MFLQFFDLKFIIVGTEEGSPIYSTLRATKSKKLNFIHDKSLIIPYNCTIFLYEREPQNFTHATFGSQDCSWIMLVIIDCLKI